ncbi:MAG TPA: PASTA domain-containing protein [Solirubrobacterales bacterium]|nr:PASTA domain-containing protein [Solirubrobacterales bacterium]
MKLHRSLPVAAVVTALLSFCATAGAANVVVGPSLSGAWESLGCGLPACIAYDTALGGTGTYVTSPISGAVVRFSVVGGSTAGTYKLRSLIPAKEAVPVAALFRKASAPVAVVPSAGIQSYPTLLSIAAGEGVGLVLSETASLGWAERPGAGAIEWGTEPAENSSASGIPFAEIAGFNVEVQPAPTVTGLGAASGPTAGGTAVPISGTDFANVTGVAFGSTPASFSVTSEGALTAVAPASAAAGAVSVKVATVAGSATAPQTFTYEAPPVLPAPVVQCVVPNLKGKTLKVAKTALEKAKCKLGTVTKLGGATAKSGKVAKQGAKAGAKVVVGTKVAVTLKPAKVAHKKGGKH